MILDRPQENQPGFWYMLDGVRIVCDVQKYLHCTPVLPFSRSLVSQTSWNFSLI